jgi:hypothetical protein
MHSGGGLISMEYFEMRLWLAAILRNLAVEAEAKG